jgi:hypothetical protein
VSRRSGLFHESEQIRATESTLTPPADAKARQNPGVRPSAERCLAHVQEFGRLADIQKL